MINKIKQEKGITLATLVITIGVLTIIVGIAIGSAINGKGILQETNQNLAEAKRESLIEKIEADLYTEKMKYGTTPTQEDLEKIITENKYGTIEEKEGQKILKNIDEENKIEIEISFSEILGWE